MKRRAVRIAFAVGLALTVGAAALWVRTFWAWETFTVRTIVIADDRGIVDDEISFGALNTGFALYRIRNNYSVYPPRVDSTPGRVGLSFEHRSGRAGRYSLLNPGRRSLFAQLGFRYETNVVAPSTGYQVVAPAWFVVLLLAMITAAFPGRAMHRDALRRRRIARGLCVNCAYDLRGAEHERCPECGQAVTPAPARAV